MISLELYFPEGSQPYPCSLKGNCGRPCVTDRRIALEESVHEGEDGPFMRGFCYQLVPLEPFDIPLDEVEAESERMAETERDDGIHSQQFDALSAQIKSEIDRVIAAKAPKRKRKYGHEGNGMKGSKTKFMEKQRKVFDAWMKKHPDATRGKKTKEPAARLCWLEHKDEWDAAKKAKGEKRGYKSPKSLAASFA